MSNHRWCAEITTSVLMKLDTYAATLYGTIALYWKVYLFIGDGNSVKLCGKCYYCILWSLCTYLVKPTETFTTSIKSLKKFLLSSFPSVRYPLAGNRQALTLYVLGNPTTLFVSAMNCADLSKINRQIVTDHLLVVIC